MLMFSSLSGGHFHQHSVHQFVASIRAIVVAQIVLKGQKLVFRREGWAHGYSAPLTQGRRFHSIEVRSQSVNHELP